MKLLLLPFLCGVCLLTSAIPADRATKPLIVATALPGIAHNEINFQDKPGRMSAIAFKSQEYCRAELKDFDFDARFSVVGATVYFTGANFRGVEKGVITSNSLKPIRNLMDRCIPGSIVTFDDVKVKGPANDIRTIDGLTLSLF